MASKFPPYKSVNVFHKNITEGVWEIIITPKQPKEVKGKKTTEWKDETDYSELEIDSKTEIKYFNVGYIEKGAPVPKWPNPMLILASDIKITGGVTDFVAAASDPSKKEFASYGPSVTTNRDEANKLYEICEKIDEAATAFFIKAGFPKKRFAKYYSPMCKTLYGPCKFKPELAHTAKKIPELRFNLDFDRKYAGNHPYSALQDKPRTTTKDYEKSVITATSQNVKKVTYEDYLIDGAPVTKNTAHKIYARNSVMKLVKLDFSGLTISKGGLKVLQHIQEAVIQVAPPEENDGYDMDEDPEMAKILNQSLAIANTTVPIASTSTDIPVASTSGSVANGSEESDDSGLED
jgi:hypothetical protein